MANKKSKHTDDLAGQKVRLAEAQAVKIEGENQLRASELVEAAGVEEAWVKAVSTVEARFLGIPAKLAPMLVNEENPLRIQRLIESEIHQALHELAKNQTQSDHTV
jgi:phage terminase Nu1 subunit (DNA packaging protein)